MKKGVKWFLVQRFLIIMFCIYCSEELITLFFGLVLGPGILSFLQSQQIEITGNSDIIGWLFYLLLYFLAEFLPSGVREWMYRWIESAMGNSISIQITSPLYSGMWGVMLRIMIIGGIVVLLLFRILPYVVGAFCYLRIVTKQFNELLAQEKEQQLAFDRRRNLLLSDIAHDIKTPITTICGYSKALAEGVAAEEKRQKYLDVIYAKSMRIDALISLLFEYVKLGSEGYELHRERGDLAELLREMTALLYTDFEERQMTLALEIPEEEVSFEMDRVQMGRAITNLLTNAVHYGKEGGRVLVRLSGYEITVADEGEPLDPALAEHIFDPFTRGDKARTSQGGSGLGLGISHKIVEMHGGQLILNQNFGEGYTKAFQMRLAEGNRS